jgi:tripartite-type tricarboxylate transporter receptor subunit TctC
MKRYGCLASLVCLVFLIESFYAPSPALSEPYFKGKKITIVIASGPGGRKDRITRTVVRYLTKYIPGKPPFIVRNIPEPAGITAAHEFLRGWEPGN